MKILKTLSAILCLIAFAVLMGACAMQDYLVPCFIDGRVGEFAESEMTSIMPYTTLADADRLDREMERTQAEWTMYFTQMLEERNLKHQFLAQGLQLNKIPAEALRETLFAPTGVFGALTGLLGLGAGAMFIKRPGDLRKEDVEEV